MRSYLTRARASVPALLVVILALGPDLASARAPEPVQRCEIAKLTAAAAELRARLSCDRGRGSALDQTPCWSTAAARRTAAFARAERGGRCPVLGDAARVGSNVESSWAGIRFSTVLSDDPVADRCAARQLTAAAREVWDRVRAGIVHEWTGDDARLRAALERQRARFDATYARLVRSADCAAAGPLPAAEYHDAIVRSVDLLRSVACPSCGAACPCWSTRELDASLPPGSFDALGGGVCDESGTGVVSADRCTTADTRTGQPRAGVEVGGGLCVWWRDDADPDGDGTCDASPLVARVDRFEQASCAAALQASRVRRSSCGADAAPRRIEPVPGPAGGDLRGVGPREWILVGGTFGVVLPWDASASAGPLPVPGCPLGEDGDCRAAIEVAAVGDVDWLAGFRSFVPPSGWREAVAVGPAGEVVSLLRREGDAGVNVVRVGPGPLFFGEVRRDDRARPVVWATPPETYQELPTDGFVHGPSPRQSDEQKRIVGDAEEPGLPVLWTPAGDGYRLETLPLLAGDVTGSATGIDGGIVSGISGNRPVVWELDGTRIRVRQLPGLRDGSRCFAAVATSRGRVVGVCRSSDDRLTVGVVWVRSAELPGVWRDAYVLAPRVGDEFLTIDGFRGDLVVGRSLHAVQGGILASGVVWRLPSVTGP